MAADEPSGPRPAPVVLRIKLRYDDIESMVQRFAPNVGKSGLFLPTKSLQPVGAEVKFELRITDDTPALVGLGRVKAAKAPDPAMPRAAFGMAIELMRVTRESREVIMRMLERRKQLGLPEVGIPMPADIDAARRAEVDTGVKESASASVPAPQAAIDTAPSEALLTAPRRQSGPIAVAKLSVVEALAPEPPRRRRPAVHEVIESASGPIVSVVSVPGLDDDVDIGAVLARARSLAGGNLDAELDALREIAAAPLEIDIEAASAELARQLGGKPVSKKDRSARWAPPPSTVSVPVAAKDAPEPAPALAPAPALEPAPAPVVAVEEPAPVSAREEPTRVAAPDTVLSSPAVVPAFLDDDDSMPVHISPLASPLASPLPVAARSTPLIDDDVDPEAFEDREPSAVEVEPEQISDEIHQLGEGDFEEVEQTQIGDVPPAEPAVAAELERSLEQQLADAEAEADGDDLGIPGAYPAPAPAQIVDDVPEETEGADEDVAEIDDFEILAEADAADADLLAAHGEADAGEIAPEVLDTPEAPEPRPSQIDFVSRLELSDEFEAVPDSNPPLFDRGASFSELDAHLGALDPRQASAGHALAAFDEPAEPPLPPPHEEFDSPHAGFGGHRAYEDDEDEIDPHFPRPHAFDESDVSVTPAPPRRVIPARDPYVLRAPAKVSPPADEGFDLETALEALDVDLDELAVPPKQPSAAPLPRTPTASPRTRAPSVRPLSQQRAASRSSGSIKVPERPSTDDGVLIQFDDDDD